MRAFPPIVAAHGDPRIVEADPRSGDEPRMHQDKPAVGIFLGGAGFPGDVGAHAKLRSHRLPGALVHCAAQHIDQISDGFFSHDALVFGCELGEHIAVLVSDAGDINRLAVFADGGDGALSGDHFQRSNWTGAER